MDNNTGMSVADVAALSNGGFGGGCNGLEGLIYLAVIMGIFNGGFGGFGFGGNGAAVATGMATQNDLQRGFDNQNSMANQREILTAVNSGTAQSVAATNQTFHDTLSVLTDKYGELARDIAAIAVGQQQSITNQLECCCSIKQLIQQESANTNAKIAEAKYENAMNLAGLEQRLTAKMDANTIQGLRDKIGALELAQATNGMLRFPNSWTYGAGYFPPVFGGCANGNV